MFASSHVTVDSSSLNCYGNDKHNGTKTASGGGPYNGKKVFRVDTGSADGFRYCNNISQDCGLNSGDYENYSYCRISDRGNGTDYYGTKIYANACQRGCAHLEQTDASCPSSDNMNAADRFKCVGRSRSCQDFPWIYVFDGSNATNLKKMTLSKVLFGSVLQVKMASNHFQKS